MDQTGTRTGRDSLLANCARTMTSAETRTEIAAAITDAVQRASGSNASISKEEALLQIAPHQLQAVLHEGFGGTNHDVLTSGLGASPGAAVGRIVLTCLLYTSPSPRDRG